MQLLRFGLIYRFQIIAFLTGLILMIYELIAARFLAPTVGSSLYVWTSVIGVIIAALSLGYWAGGVLADARKRREDVVGLLLIAALAMTLTLFMYQPILDSLLQTGWDTRLQAVLAASILFAPTSFVLGMISPYLVKLEVQSLDVAGRKVASLSALNSIGGIVGTFLAGFFLFGWIGSRETLVALVVIAVVSSWALQPKFAWRIRVATSLVLLGLVFIGGLKHQENIIDTASARYTVIEWRNDDRTLRGLLAGPSGIQSGVDINQPDSLVFWYTRALAEVVDQAPEKQDILMLGGGTLTLPQALAGQYPDSQIDVVEIDPELFELARDKFFYQDPANVELIAADARSYVETTNKKYDVILVDAYQDGQMPFTMTTHQFAAELRQRLNPDGVVALNLIAGKSGACGDLLAAVDQSFEAALGAGKFNLQQQQAKMTNLIAAYGKIDNLPNSYQPLDLNTGVRLTDNFAPTDRLTSQCQNS